MLFSSFLYLLSYIQSVAFSLHILFIYEKLLSKLFDWVLAVHTNTHSLVFHNQFMQQMLAEHFQREHQIFL